MTLGAMFGFALVLWPLAFSQRRIARTEGILLLLAYLGYLGWLGITA